MDACILGIYTSCFCNNGLWPIAAFLVEMFPIRIRYTSMSLPYHIGNGVFGGLLPAVATYLVTSAKDAGQNPEYYLQGLWYPIVCNWRLF